MTLNNRLEMAAAAMATRMVIFSTPRVVLPVLPFRNGSSIVGAIMGWTKGSRHAIGGFSDARYAGINRSHKSALRTAPNTCMPRTRRQHLSIRSVLRSTLEQGIRLNDSDGNDSLSASLLLI